MVQVHAPQGVEVRVLSWAPTDSQKKYEKPRKALSLRGFLYLGEPGSGGFTYVCQLQGNAKTRPKSHRLSDGQGLFLAHTSEWRKDLAAA
jgi:hypothetical protein